MNGHELACDFAVRYPTTRVIFLTTTNVKYQVPPRGAVPVHRKAVCSERIRQRVAEILGERAPDNQIEFRRGPLRVHSALIFSIL
jgi:hypothetical protein